MEMTREKTETPVRVTFYLVPDDTVTIPLDEIKVEGSSLQAFLNGEKIAMFLGNHLKGWAEDKDIPC